MDERPDEQPAITPSLTGRIAAICDQYKRQLKSGQRPLIEDHLAGWEEPRRTELLREVLLIELDHSRPSDSVVSQEEFCRRFPDDTAMISEVFAVVQDKAALPTVWREMTQAPVRKAESSALTVGGRFGDYEILEEIARGGMGVVYKARQTKLNRIVALKMIKSGQFADDSEVRRFHAEAEAAAALDHPNIVPIHEVGECDGQHFFSMGFVDGEGLDTKLKDGPLPPKEAAALIKTIAEAVQYAHEKGIVHRDLKPGNVLLAVEGPASRVQRKDAEGMQSLDPEPATRNPRITDYGLAKNVAADSGITTTGQILGTPSYMPPEQAAGDMANVGPLADVYSLGAMLYTTLTGRPPFQAANVMETLKQVLEREPVSPRQLNPAVDKDLETICLKCLEKDTAKRYGSAQDLASELDRFLAHKPILARPVGRFERGRRWTRRNPLVAVLSGTAVLLLIAVAVAGTVGYRQNARAVAAETEKREAAARKEADKRQAVETGLARVAELREQLRWREARVALEHTQSRLGNHGWDDLQQRLKRETAMLDLIDRLETIQLKRATLIDRLDIRRFRSDSGTHAVEGQSIENKSNFKSVEREYALAFEKARIAKIGDDPKAVATRIRSSPITKQLIAALDSWASATKDETQLTWVLAIARQADPHKQRDLLRDPKAWKEKALLSRRIQETPAKELTAPLAVALAIRVGLRNRNIVAMLRATYLQHPRDFWVVRTLAMAHLAVGKREEAEGYYRVALSLRPEVGSCWTQLGACLAKSGNLDEAILYYQKAIDLIPKHATSFNNLGVLLVKAKRLQEAETVYRRAIELDPKNAATRNNLGILLRESKRTKEAEAEFRQAIELAPRDNSAHINLGILLYKTNRMKDAEAAFRKAIEIDPKFATAYSNLGGPLMATHRLKEAELAFRKAIEIDPKFATAHNSLGHLLRVTNRLKEAEAEFRMAIGLDPKYATPHFNLGLLLRQTKRLKEAEAEYRKAIELDPTDSVTHNNLGDLLSPTKRWKEAEAELRKAIELEPKNATVHFNLGTLLTRTKRLTEAEAEFRKAIALNPKDAIAYKHLGALLARTKRLLEAEAAYRKSIELSPKYASAHTYLASLLVKTNRLKEAEMEFRKAIALDPNDPNARLGLGVLLLRTKRPDEAIEIFRKAIVVDPNNVWYYRLLGLVLANTKRFNEAERAFRKAIDLDPKYAKTYVEFGNLLKATNRPTDAEAAYRRAIELDPRYAKAHNTLGILLVRTKRIKEAEARYREAIKLNPKYVAAHYNLGLLLMRDKTDCFAEAVAILKHGQVMAGVRWSSQARRMIADAERLLALDRKLTAIKSGRSQVRNATEAVTLADFALVRKHQPRIAAKLFQTGLGDKSLPPRLRFAHQYNAACAALRCANGTIEKGAKPPDAAEAKRLRQQALKWLNANLATNKQLMKENPKARTNGLKILRFWQIDSDLAVVRGNEIDRLPQAERNAWRSLWDTVRATLRANPVKARRPRSAR